MVTSERRMDTLCPKTEPTITPAINEAADFKSRNHALHQQLFNLAQTVQACN
jgi:hypothetical protein